MPTPRYADDHCSPSAPPVHRLSEETGATLRERRNWSIFAAYARQDYPECLRIIEEQLRECKGLAEYPIYVKGIYDNDVTTLHRTMFQGFLSKDFKNATIWQPQKPISVEN